MTFPAHVGSSGSVASNMSLVSIIPVNRFHEGFLHGLISGKFSRFWKENYSSVWNDKGRTFNMACAHFRASLFHARDQTGTTLNLVYPAASPAGIFQIPLKSRQPIHNRSWSLPRARQRPGTLAWIRKKPGLNFEPGWATGLELCISSCYI